MYADIDNYRLLVPILIRSLRGDRPQKELSRLLGFQYNKVSLWERGVHNIKWQQFIKLCDICEIDAKQIMIISLNYYGKTDWEHVINHIYPHSMKTLQESIKKIVNKEIKDPPLQNCLYAIDFFSFGFAKFLNSLCDTFGLPEPFKSIFEHAQSHSVLVKNSIEANLIFHGIMLDSYLNTDVPLDLFMLERYRIPIETTQRVTQVGIKYGLISLDKQNGKYYRNLNKNPEGLYLSSLFNSKSHLVITNKFAKLGIETIKKMQNNPVGARNLAGYLVVNSNEEHLDKIISLTNNYYKQVQALCQSTPQNSDRLALLNLQLFDENALRNVGVFEDFDWDDMKG